MHKESSNYFKWKVVLEVGNLGRYGMKMTEVEMCPPQQNGDPKSKLPYKKWLVLGRAASHQNQARTD